MTIIWWPDPANHKETNQCSARPQIAIASTYSHHKIYILHSICGDTFDIPHRKLKRHKCHDIISSYSVNDRTCENDHSILFKKLLKLTYAYRYNEKLTIKWPFITISIRSGNQLKSHLELLVLPRQQSDLLSANVCCFVPDYFTWWSVLPTVA